jgi:hypothetical protein
MDTHVTQGGIDPAWDDFLCAVQAGRHEQSSPYGQLKDVGLAADPRDRRRADHRRRRQILARSLPAWAE